MLRISKIETEAQEILLWVTVVSAAFFFAGCALYIYLSPAVVTSILGQSGGAFFKFLFQEFGYAAFLSSLLFWSVGNAAIASAHSFRDVFKAWKRLLFTVIAHVFFIVMAASFATILQTYFHFAADNSLRLGAGGGAGLAIGGELFRHFGLFGSIVILLGLAVVVGIASHQFELVSFILTIKAWSIYSVKETWFWLGVFYHWVLAKIGIQESKLADSFMEFEVATGQYVTVHTPPPTFIHHFVDKNLEPETPLEKKVELPSAEAAQKSAAAGSPPVALDLAQIVAKRRGKAAKIKDSEKPEEKENEKPQKENANQTEPTQGSPEVEVKAYTKRYSKPDSALLRNPAKQHVPSKTEINKLRTELETRLASFKLPGKIIDVHSGSRLTLFEFMPDAGVKLSKIASLANDLALLLGADSIRILTPIPGKTTVGIEVPNTEPNPIYFSELVKGVEKAAKEKPLAIALGKNVYNDVVTGDIASMPHLLISGTTGSGKSVFMNTLITSLLYTRSPKELRFLMIDPKMIELSPYNGIPHLLKPVVTDVVEAKNVLQWAEREMDRRYQMFGETGSRNIVSFNEMIEKGSQTSVERKAGKKLEWEWREMPYIVVVIDELADLMITQGKDVEIPITRIAQKARAAGIHMVIATQRPSAEIVTGLIKTNFPTRIAFKVSSAIDSRTILDASGAEKLLGNGDMLYMPNGKSIERIQASFLSEEEVKKIVKTIMVD